MKRKYILAIFLFLLFAAVVFFFASNESKQLERNFKVTKAVFNGLGNSRNAGERLYINYKFTWNGETYYGNTGLDCNRNSKEKISRYMANKEVTIVFYPKNPKNSKAVLSTFDLKKYHLIATKQDSILINELSIACNK